MTTDYIILRSPDYRAANRVVNNAIVIAASDDPEEIAAALEAMGGDEEALRDHIEELLVMRDGLENINALTKAEEQRLKTLRQEREMRVDKIERVIAQWMQAAGWTNLQLATHDVRQRAGVGRVEITDESLVPPEYMRTPPPPEPVPDKKKIAEQWKAGLEITGTKFIVEPTLQIK